METTPKPDSPPKDTTVDYPPVNQSTAPSKSTDAARLKLAKWVLVLFFAFLAMVTIVAMCTGGSDPSELYKIAIWALTPMAMLVLSYFFGHS